MSSNKTELLQLQISDLYLSDESTSLITQSVLDTIRQFLNCDYIDLYIYGQEIRDKQDNNHDSPFHKTNSVSEEEYSIIIITDLLAKESKSELELSLVNRNLASYIKIPLEDKSMVFAELVIASSQGNHLSESMVRSIIQIAQTLSRALANNIHKNKLIKQTEHLAIIREIEHNIINEQSSKSIATTAVSKIRTYLSCEHSAIFLFDFDSKNAVLIANDSSFSLGISNGDSIPFDIYTISDDIYSHIPQVQSDLAKKKNLTKVESYIHDYGINSYLSIPLIAYNQLLGVLNLASSNPNFFKNEDIETAKDISTSIAIALHQSKMREQIQNQNDSLESTIAERTKQLTELNSELVLNKLAMQHIADNVPGAVFRYSIKSDLSYNIDFISRGCLEIFGLCSTEMIGKGLEVLNIFPDDKESFFDSLLISHANLNQWSYQFRISLSETEIKWIRVLAQPTHSIDNTVTWTGTFTDITNLINSQEEIIRLNSELQDNIVRLEAANKELEAFSYSVSHDLRSPLRSMNGFSEVLIEEYFDKLDDTAKDYLLRIQNASNKMAKLIDDLLKLSRLTRTDIQRTEIDIIPIAKEILSEIGKHSINQVYRLHIQDSIVVNADRALLKILLTNILSNASKFSGKMELSIIEISSEEINNSTYICIKDNGAGFDMNYKNKIFGAFQRLHTDKDFEGTGIGLAIVQRIINKHGGEIFAESEINVGTKIFFNFG